MVHPGRAEPSNPVAASEEDGDAESTHLGCRAGQRPIRVLVVEDHRVVADGLSLALGSDPELQVVGVAATVAEAARLAENARPDVVLMDYHLPDGTGAEAAMVIRSHLPNVAVVVLTADGSEEALMEAVAAGASGFLSKSQAASQVLDAVRRAAEGEMLIPATTLASLLGRQRRKAQQERERIALVDALTPREHEVLSLMAQGLDNRAIAERLVIGYTTVRSHVQNILDKLGARSKLEAVARASEYGLLDR